MAVTGYDRPQMEKPSMPKRLAKLRPSRTVGKTPIINTPTACEAMTNSVMATRMGSQPLANGKAL